ncbi:MAG: HAMP domain-containing sensor histidine kinase [Planctomycetota bacterium]
MRLRTRLTIALVTAHLVFTALAGWIAWSWVDQSLRQQAEDSARAVGRVLAHGGFSADERVLSRMRELSGHDFRLVSSPTPTRAGAVLITEGTVTVEVDYHNARHEAARQLLLNATLAIAGLGTIAFAAVAWLLARHFARPIEELGDIARHLAGDLTRAVPRIGAGEVQSLAVELEAMRCRLVAAVDAARRTERLATLGTFAATVAHEVRNPLTAVRLAVQMLAKEHPGGTDLPRIEDELERLDLIVDEVLSFARGMHCEPIPTDLRAIVDDAVRLLRRQADHAGVELIVNGNPTNVRADPRRLRQLLLNLVLNAIQACSGGRGNHVTVSVHADGFAVSDDGPGLPSAIAAQLFAAFTTEREGGTGLGLHLAKAVADAHGAQLVHQALNPGTRFVLSHLKIA